MKNILMILAAMILAALSSISPAFAQSAPSKFMQTRTSEAGHFTVTIASENPSFERNALHAWIVTVDDAAGKPVEDAQIVVTGGMAMHNHGLPTDPQMTANLGGGRYKIDGVRFHMAGTWQFNMTITSGTITDTARFELIFKE